MLVLTLVSDGYRLTLTLTTAMLVGIVVYFYCSLLIADVASPLLLVITFSWHRRHSPANDQDAINRIEPGKWETNMILSDNRNI